ncbi:MAG: TraR/DksA C4-type zinc finger protein [Desulfobacterales bacterium]
MNMSDIRQQLLDRRKEIIEDREGKIASWHKLHEREVEFEEEAAKQTLARSLEKLDEQEKEEIEQIDAALGKLETGIYGICEACGKEISESRLKAIPWAPICIECAEKREGGASRAAEVVGETAGSGLSGEPRGYTDEELQEMIKDELVLDGRIETQELKISASEGRIYLKGLLPSKNKHEILISTIQDVLGFKNIVDQVRIDRQLWEQRKFNRGVQTEEISEKEKKMESEGGQTDAWSSAQNGTSLDPPDKLVPE